MSGGHSPTRSLRREEQVVLDSAYCARRTRRIPLPAPKERESASGRLFSFDEGEPAYTGPMTKTTLVTGNPNKLIELQEIAGDKLDLTSRSIDLPEIQSLDLNEIVEYKVKAAYAIVQGPVIVEDVSAGLDDLGGLPGPFYKFFREKLGDTILVKLATLAASNKVTIQCLAAYYDGSRLLYGLGIIHGTVVEPRGTNGFGFDPVVMPDGQTRTMAEMARSDKNAISHRGQALAKLFAQL